MSLPATPPPPERVMADLVMGFIRSRAVFVAAELALADHLADGPASAEELARRSGGDPGAVARLLRTLASVGVFDHLPDGRYALNERGELLRSDAPGSMRDYARYFGGLANTAWTEAVHAFRTGRAGFEQAFGQSFWPYVDGHPEVRAVFNGAMSGRAGARAAAVRSYDWRGDERVVDLGGADGGVLIDLLSRHPGMTGAVVDLPQAVAEARERIAAAGLEDRLSAVEGDLFEHIPVDGDVYLLVIILHDWDDERAARILATCRAHMRPDARLLLVERVIGEEADSLTQLADLHILVEVGGRERTEDDWRALLGGAGFRLEQRLPTVPWNLLVAAPA